MDKKQRINLDPQIMGNIMYSFLTDLQIKEIERLSDRNQKLKNGLPVGIIYEKGGP